ncbi:uncharacterized protein EI97DRAFT_234999 [Westerdykella ornata]|uniref:Uncharacterized protein n=1 Tax=Westerdykella ornata TaxID=318751 RepID=A0A6A6J6V0_WESOR|nr:uncharacterized protein EI97DRAFT_234999 [Westerdykella ornata]KAF2272142.1 hypothetical protein EI97DRAFT_234999 [Westerdykella ornata]
MNPTRSSIAVLTPTRSALPLLDRSPRHRNPHLNEMPDLDVLHLPYGWSRANNPEVNLRHAILSSSPKKKNVLPSRLCTVPTYVPELSIRQKNTPTQISHPKGHAGAPSLHQAGTTCTMRRQ